MIKISSHFARLCPDFLAGTIKQFAKGQIMIEIIVYNIKEDQLDSFNVLKPQLIKEAMTIPGIISSKTHVSESNKWQFVDVMEWESNEAMKDGFEAFKILPSTKDFMALMTGPPVFAGKFKGEDV
ncbi:hypothetical protein MNBD_ALPHA11-805 [hydrothermal vent metagenome]|uniref:ABM domain-containing protein n=1 Tax=hydrothermal vent metagenome TaxID=652676 RepID=A0A3B0U1J7_9ZZZZ